jgi:DNA-binding response OmpR family regulator
MVQQAILVVDDEAPMRKFVSHNLKADGYQVLTAADGSEALKLASEHPLDLLLLDIGLPGPDGLAVLQAVRRDMQVPVLMISARGREADRVRALDLGADDYLTKPPPGHAGAEGSITGISISRPGSGFWGTPRAAEYC